MYSETYEEVYNDLKVLAKKASEYSRKGEFYNAVCISKFVSNVLYYYNFTYRMDSLDEVVKIISDNVIRRITIKNPSSNTILFYDRFGLADRGLASIYVRALLKLGYDVTWLLFESAKDERELKSKFPQCRFIVVPRINIMRRMNVLKEVVADIAPKNLFLYTEPNDVEGVALFSSILGDCNRFLIDLTDHAYWLGKGSADFYIEFRNLGRNIAIEHRGIDSNQIRMLPYYPENREGYAYEGMPFSEEHPFFFSGGSSYKIEGSNVFDEIVCHILETYKDLYFVYAHEHGIHSSKLNVLKEKYKERVHLIEERKDIDQIMRRAKFYLGTYPIGGGLMTQYAVRNKCFPICFSDKDIFSNPKTWLLKEEEIDFVFSDLEQLYDKVDRILTGAPEEESRRNRLIDHVISENDFTEKLKSILECNGVLDNCTISHVNSCEFQSFYKKRFSYSQYRQMVDNSGNPWIKEFYSSKQMED